MAARWDALVGACDGTDITSAKILSISLLSRNPSHDLKILNETSRVSSVPGTLWSLIGQRLGCGRLELHSPQIGQLHWLTFLGSSLRYSQRFGSVQGLSGDKRFCLTSNDIWPPAACRRSQKQKHQKYQHITMASLVACIGASTASGLRSMEHLLVSTESGSALHQRRWPVSSPTSEIPIPTIA